MSATTLENPVQFYAKPKTASAEVWSLESIEALINQPFADLLFQAQQVHRAHFKPNEVQLSTLLSIKTGGCQEDCAYCPQSVHHDTGVEASKLLDVEAVREAALAARANTAGRPSAHCSALAARPPGACRSTTIPNNNTLHMVPIIARSHAGTT